MVNLRLICFRNIHYFRDQGAAHRHQFFQVFYVLQGSGIVWVDGERYTLGPGSVHSYHPYRTHRIRPGSVSGMDALDLCFVIRDPEMIMQMADLPVVLDSETERILELLQKIRHVGAERNTPLWQDLAHAYAVQLLQALLGGRRKAGTENAIHTDEIVREAVRRMVRSLPLGVEVRRLASDLHIDPAHLAVLFRSTLGKSPKTFMTELKIEGIRHHLLTRPEVNVSELAKEFGWQDLRHFREVFKRMIGRTPSVLAAERALPERTGNSLENAIYFDATIPLRRELAV